MSEIIYRSAYTEGYQQAIKDVTAYKIPKITAKKFSIDELKKWQTFQDEYYDDFCKPPICRYFISIPQQKEKLIKQEISFSGIYDCPLFKTSYTN